MLLQRKYVPTRGGWAQYFNISATITFEHGPFIGGDGVLPWDQAVRQGRFLLCEIWLAHRGRSDATSTPPTPEVPVGHKEGDLLPALLVDACYHCGMVGTRRTQQHQVTEARNALWLSHHSL